MGFSRLKTAPAATSPPVPVAAAPVLPPVSTVTVVAQVAAPASAPQASAGFGLSIPSMSANVLALVAGHAEESATFSDLFPTLVIKGGNAGGTMSPSNGTPKDIANMLPQGKQPVHGIFMAYRVEAIAWPTGFDDKGEKDKPTINVAIPCNDVDNVTALLKASDNFQFCSDKTKWSAASGGPGHVRPVFQMLVYLPQFDDVVVLQAPGLLKSWQTMSQLLNGMAAPDGSLVAFPAVFEPTTAPWYDTNVFHYFNITPQVNAQGKEWMQKYGQFIAGVKDSRPDLVQSINDWFSSADKPLDGDGKAKLLQAAGMINPRRSRG